MTPRKYLPTQPPLSLQCGKSPLHTVHTRPKSVQYWAPVDILEYIFPSSLGHVLHVPGEDHEEGVTWGHPHPGEKVCKDNIN